LFDCLASHCIKKNSMWAEEVRAAKLVAALLCCAAQLAAGDVMVDNLLSYVERSRDIFMAGPGDIACKAACQPPAHPATHLLRATQYPSAHRSIRVFLAQMA